MRPARHEVVVVGGGAVGATTALALARAGFDVALLEQGGPPPAFDAGRYDPRVYALSPGSLRFLEALGVWPAVAAARVAPIERMEIWESVPERALCFDAAELGAPALGSIVEDGLLRAALWQVLAGRVRVQAPAAVTGLELGGGRPCLRLQDGGRLEADLVVAAEGAASPLRAWAGIEPLGWSYHQRALVCHVETGEPHHATALQRFLPGGPLAFLPLADGRSSIVWSTRAEEADHLLALAADDFRERLGEAIDHRLGDIGACSPRLAFPLRLLHAGHYAVPGLALVGDSAHVVHPLAGQGLNLGLGDAQALAEVLAPARAAGRPIGALRLLQRYERRRKAENVEMLALTDGLDRLFRLRTPGLGALRELGLSLVSQAGPLKQRLARRAMGL